MKDLDIKLKYRTYYDDILEDFYIPVLTKAKYYYRAVGYFSSSILLDYSKGLVRFLKNNGEINLIISPYLTENDLDELNRAQSHPEEGNLLDKLFESYLLGNERIIAASKLFVMLINSGKLKVLVAEPKNLRGLFHEKIGIFIDEHDNKIAIIGSNNETGNAVKFNLESFNTFCSWKEGQQIYIDEHIKDFNNYWTGENDNIRLKDIKEALSENIIKKFATNESIDDLISIIEEEKIPYSIGFTPYDYQVEAVNKWLIKEKGIFKFATGSGKTKTALYLIEKIKESYSRKYFIIVVPDKTLVNQWYDEIISRNQYAIKCFSDNKNWQSDLRNIIDVFTMYEKRHQYIIVTNDTFFNDRFQREVKKLKEDYLLIVDECHTWGTNRILNMLPNTKMRLGLSATPELFFSEEKTAKLLDYFGGNISEYTLENAINDGRLVGYYYHPIFVKLNDQEKEQYDILTQRIVKMIGIDVDDLTDKYSKALEMLLFKRARIVYGAHNKIEKLSELIDDLKDKGRLLVYCGPTSYSNDFDAEIEIESITQLQDVNRLFASIGMKFAQYTSQENEYERMVALSLFKKDTYSTLVAIKCLDEGIDIPQIERAVILASSTNPREFIQRRGRILRTYPGKKFSEIYDFIVYEENYESLIKKELERFYEFARIAINGKELLEKYMSILNIYLFEGRNV